MQFFVQLCRHLEDTFENGKCRNVISVIMYPSNQSINQCLFFETTSKDFLIKEGFLQSHRFTCCIRLNNKNNHIIVETSRERVRQGSNLALAIQNHLVHC